MWVWLWQPLPHGMVWGFFNYRVLSCMIVLFFPQKTIMFCFAFGILRTKDQNLVLSISFRFFKNLFFSQEQGSPLFEHTESLQICWDDQAPVLTGYVFLWISTHSSVIKTILHGTWLKITHQKSFNYLQMQRCDWILIEYFVRHICFGNGFGSVVISDVCPALGQIWSDLKVRERLDMVTEVKLIKDASPSDWKKLLRKIPVLASFSPAFFAYC